MVYTGTAVVIIKCCRQHTNALVITYIMNLKGLQEGGRCLGGRNLNAAKNVKGNSNNWENTMEQAPQPQQLQQLQLLQQLNESAAQRRDISPRSHLWSSMRLGETFLNCLTCSLCLPLPAPSSRITIP